MKRVVGVFIEGVQVELFNDEQINVNSSVQNISDISKVFTDFSQSFTVPASPHNNNIFQHFYESDVTQTIDNSKRRNAYIEIDLTFFRRGKIQLEKANLINGKVESYTITFYGDILALKDKFGEDKLKDLDYTSLQFSFTGANVYNRITNTNTDYDVRYPLIANDKLWVYKQSGIDITDPAHEIQYNELFPALRVTKIIEAIESKYGITFQSSYLQDPRFKSLFLWCKNTINYSWVSESKLLDIVSYPSAAANIFDFTNDTVNINYTTTLGGQSFNSSSAIHFVYVYIGGLITDEYFIDVFINDNFYSTINGTGSNNYQVYKIQNISGLQNKIKIYVRGLQSFTFPSYITYQMTYLDNSNQPNSETFTANNATTTVSGNINLNNVMPDIKVSDFFSGVLKQFNMTCVGVEQDVYELLPLDLWYSEGVIEDVTEYTDLDSIEVAKTPMYKKINFKYQESESFTNKNYFKTYQQQYGDAGFQFDIDGSEFNVELPFENLLFTRSQNNSGEYAILGYALNETYQAYVPKPCLLYYYGASETLPHAIKFYNGTATQNITKYALFGQDLTHVNTKYSLNFGADNSIIHLETINNGLYYTYYFPYLSNLFNLKQRLISVKANLPISLLTTLRLNDRLIIRDKRYVINEMKSNLTTGDVDFSLYLDFRPLIADDTITPDPSPQCFTYNVPFIRGATSANLTSVTSVNPAGVTITPSTITQTTLVDICIPANAYTPSNILAENTNPIITESGLNLITEESRKQPILISALYNMSDGTQIEQFLTIIQE